MNLATRLPATAAELALGFIAVTATASAAGSFDCGKVEPGRIEASATTTRCRRWTRHNA